MGIGSSKGAFYEDEFAQLKGLDLNNPGSTPDNNEWSPNEIMPHPDELPMIQEVANKGPGGNVSVLRVPANDNRNLDLGTGIDIDQAWNDLKKKLGAKPNLTIVPKFSDIILEDISEDNSEEAKNYSIKPFQGFRRSENIEDRRLEKYKESEVPFSKIVKQQMLNAGGRISDLVSEVLPFTPTELGIQAGINDIEIKPKSSK